MTTKRDAQHRALWDSWAEFCKSAQKSAELRISEIFTQIKQAACIELNRSAACFAHLGTTDEDVYVGLYALMDVYRHVVELADSVNLTDHLIIAIPGFAGAYQDKNPRHQADSLSQGSAYVKRNCSSTLLNGLCEVLNSRIKEFSEVAADGVENPVTCEKNTIIDRAASQLVRCIDDMGETFVEWFKYDAEQSPHPAIQDIIIDEFMPQIFDNFNEALRNCLAELDDLHMRKSAGFYMELFEREWETFGNIIKVQVLALESAAEAALEFSDTDDLPTIHHILNILREAYQYIGPIYGELKRRLAAPPSHGHDIAIPSLTGAYQDKNPRHQADSLSQGSTYVKRTCSNGTTYEDFVALISCSISKSTAEPDEMPQSRFFELLDEEVVALFDVRTELEKAACQMQRVIGSDKQLAEEICGAFLRVKENLANAVPACQGELQYDILKGISETINIKIESLQDSIDSFEHDGVGLLRSFSEEVVSPTVNECKQAQHITRAAWLKLQPQNPEFFTELLSYEPYTNYQARIDKLITTYHEKTEKLTFKFKKDVLLYEICTYEEILTHSVSHLRGSEAETIVGIAAMLDDAYAELTVLLENNNIIAICPTPHQAFNAFEHNVLVAEPQEGFNKGEIIKMINTGYKQKDKVILRANVIAAR